MCSLLIISHFYHLLSNHISCNSFFKYWCSKTSCNSIHRYLYLRFSLFYKNNDTHHSDTTTSKFIQIIHYNFPFLNVMNWLCQFSSSLYEKIEFIKKKLHHLYKFHDCFINVQDVNSWRGSPPVLLVSFLTLNVFQSRYWSIILNAIFSICLVVRIFYLFVLITLSDIF